MEFLVEFDVEVPPGTPDDEVEQRQRAESIAAAELADQGHLVRLWRRPLAGDGATSIGLYHADSAAQLDGLLDALPLADWLQVTVTPLEAHPNDPDAAASSSRQLPNPRLTRVFRLEASLGEPLDLGETAQGRRRIVPLTGGTFTGPELNGTLLPGASADWQIVLPDGTALGDVATRSERTAAICSTSSHEVCATAAPRCSHVWAAERTSTRASTCSAAPCRSRPAPRHSTG